MNRALLISIVLAALPLFAGCSTPAPRVEVQEVAVTEQSPEGIVVTFVLLAENRGGEPLPLRTVEYSMNLEGRPAFRGTRSAEATIPRYGSNRFLLPVALTVGPGKDLEQAPTQQLGYALSGSVQYEVPGTIAEVLFDNNIRRPTVGFSERGRLDFSNTAPAAIPAPAPASTP